MKKINKIGIYRNNTVEFQGTKNKKVEPNALEQGNDDLQKRQESSLLVYRCLTVTR